MGNGVTRCDAGIQTQAGLLNFRYDHNMMIAGCISYGEPLRVEVLDANGTAHVERVRAS